MIRAPAMLALLAAALACLPIPVRAQSGCAAMVDELNSLVRGGELARIEALTQRIQDDAGCDAATRDSAGRAAATAYLREAIRRASAGAPAAEQLQLIDAGLRLGRPWQMLAAAGDVLQDTTPPDYALASRRYQEALNDLRDNPLAGTPPQPVIIGLFRKAQQTRMLASRLVLTPPVRDGSRGGLALTSLRGVSVERVALPIHFVRDSAEMTPLGREAADDMWHMLDEQQRPPIVLVGHTDPDGSDEFNMQLSRRRVEAVATFLRAQGYDTQRIRIEWRGKREPLQIENRERYSQAEIYQMLRRVELARP